MSSRNRDVPCRQTDGQTDTMKLIVVFRNSANATKNEEIQKSSIRVDSTPDEIPMEYLHNKYTDLTLHKCVAGCGFHSNEYRTWNVYRSPSSESAQGTHAYAWHQRIIHTSAIPATSVPEIPVTERPKNRAAVTHLQIPYVPPKFLIKWDLVTSRSTMDKIFLLQVSTSFTDNCFLFESNWQKIMWMVSSHVILLRLLTQRDSFVV